MGAFHAVCLSTGQPWAPSLSPAWIWCLSKRQVLRKTGRRERGHGQPHRPIGSLACGKQRLRDRGKMRSRPKEQWEKGTKGRRWSTERRAKGGGEDTEGSQNGGGGGRTENNERPPTKSPQKEHGAHTALGQSGCLLTFHFLSGTRHTV